MYRIACSIGLSFVVACSSSSPDSSEMPDESGTSEGADATTGGETPEPETTGDDGSTGEVEEPGWQLPEVWGVPVLEDENPDENIVEVTLTAAPLQVALSETETLTMLAYNGSVPGPLLQAKVGDEVVVHFENRLDEPTTVHWHGLRISEEMDGNPRIQEPVQPGEDFTYRYVVEEAGSYWYHPHVNANTQVEMGMQAPDGRPRPRGSGLRSRALPRPRRHLAGERPVPAAAEQPHGNDARAAGQPPPHQRGGHR